MHKETEDATKNTLAHNGPIPFVRSAISGLLMGLANLVPGVSGGTMILIMGLYNRFISAVADVTKLRFSLRSLGLLAIIGGVAGITIVSLSEPLAQLVVGHPAVMYGLFIGMTLGGVPLLFKMVQPITDSTATSFYLGFLLMFTIGFASAEVRKPSDIEESRTKAMIEQGQFELKPQYGLDVTAGVLGMSAMVLPGISGAYMLLVLGRYVQILAAVSLGAKYILTFGKQGDPAAFHIIIPVAIGVVLSVVVVSNILKWLLRRHEAPTLGFLLGILIASVYPLLGRIQARDNHDFAIAATLACVGFVATVLLGYVGNKRASSD